MKKRPGTNYLRAEFEKKSDGEKLEAFSKKIEAYEAERVISSKLGSLGVDTSKVKEIIQGGNIEQSVDALAEVLTSLTETAKTSAVQSFKQEQHTKIAQDAPQQKEIEDPSLTAFKRGMGL